MAKKPNAKSKQKVQIKMGVDPAQPTYILVTSPTKIEIKVLPEKVFGRNPARVLVYTNDQLIAEISAKIDHLKGADGGWYPCVTFQTKVPPST